MSETKKSANSKIANQEGWVSIILNSTLFVLKYWAGLVSGSVAIIADAWHTLSDTFSSIIIIAGAKLSSKPPDNEHPFGHGRAELIAAVLVAAFLGFVAFEFIQSSIIKLKNREIAVFGALAIIATVTSIILKEGLAQYAFYTWKKTGYLSLKADAWHHRSDAISSVIVLIGIFLGKYYWWIDGVLGILVALMIGYAAYGILKGTISKLLGEAPDNQLVEQIKTIASKETIHDIQIHHIHLHTYGEHQELTFHIRLPNKMTVEESHTLVTAIRQKLRDTISIEATIHIEPCQRQSK